MRDLRYWWHGFKCILLLGTMCLVFILYLANLRSTTSTPLVKKSVMVWHDQAIIPKVSIEKTLLLINHCPTSHGMLITTPLSCLFTTEPFNWYSQKGILNGNMTNKPPSWHQPLTIVSKDKDFRRGLSGFCDGLMHEFLASPYSGFWIFYYGSFLWLRMKEILRESIYM